MGLVAVFLAGITVLLTGVLIGYLWGREDGQEAGYARAYGEVNRWYNTRRREGRVER